MKPVAIEARGLAKTFEIPEHRVDSLKERALHAFRRIETRKLRALDDVSFEVGRGEFFGIVGRNGSGKSTLLKILASIYGADRGEVRLAGRLAPFIELGVGFQPDLPARENVVLNGVMMGLSRREIEARVDTVLDFAELREFGDLALKNYSSGMTVRLAFSVMLESDADVLLIDEVLAVGDAEFAQKAAAAFAEIKAAGRTVVLVTHDMDEVRRHCDRALWLDTRPRRRGRAGRRSDRCLRGGPGEVSELRPIPGPGALGGGGQRFRELLVLIATYEFKRTYYGTALGYLWSLLRPFILFGVLLVVFTQIFRAGAGIENYEVMLLLNIVLFGFFQEATTNATPAMVRQERIVRKTQFPRLVIPLAHVLTGLMNLGTNLIAVLIFALALRGRAELGLAALSAPDRGPGGSHRRGRDLPVRVLRPPPRHADHVVGRCAPPSSTAALSCSRSSWSKTRRSATSSSATRWR